MSFYHYIHYFSNCGQFDFFISVKHKNYILKYHKRPKKNLNTSKNYNIFFVFRIEYHNYDFLGEKRRNFFFYMFKFFLGRL